MGKKNRTLPSSPNPISMSQVATELGIPHTGLNFNDLRVRRLAERPTNISTISMSDLRGKSDTAFGRDFIVVGSTPYTSQGLACTDTGIVYLRSIGSDFYKSTDSGVSFSKMWDLNYDVYSQMACSSDGRHAYSYNTYRVGSVCKIQKTNDNGYSWTEIDVPHTNNVNSNGGICCSDSGQIVYIEIGQYGGRALLYRSTNYGASFHSYSSFPVAYPSALACSGDGTILFFSNAGYLWKSTDSGISFTKGTYVAGMSQICCSSDAKYVYCENANSVYRSINSGAAFSEVGHSGKFGDILALTCSPSGRSVYLCNSNKQLYRS